MIPPASDRGSSFLRLIVGVCVCLVPAQTSFSKRYRCGDLPVSVDHGHSKPAIRWLVEPERLDLHYYLPLFFDGLRETRFPESMLARQGVVTLIEMGGQDCVAIVGKLIQPIKSALNTRDPSTIILTLNTLAKLVRQCPCFYRVSACD